MCGRRDVLRRRLPAHVRHMGAATSAAGRVLVVLDTGLERRGRHVAGRMRGRSDTARVAVTAGCRVGAADAQMGGERTSLLKIREFGGVSVHAAGEIHTRGHGHGTLGGRRSRQRRAVAREMVTVRARLHQVLVGRAGKGRRTCHSRLLDRTGVVVLMACEGGFAGKRLLAIRVGANVWALAGVCSSMSGKGAAVAKLLATRFALMRLLAGMDTLVDGQRRPLDKLLSADLAGVGSVSRVDALCELPS